MLASKTFTSASQERFAVLSGDRNPMHMDPLAARRTAAGAQAVHGIHLVLWSLDALAQNGRLPEHSASLRISVLFATFVLINEPVCAVLDQADDGEARISIAVNGQVRFSILVGSTNDCCEPIPPHRPESLHWVPTPQPNNPDIDTMDTLAGSLSYACTPRLVGAEFPFLASRIGDNATASLATMSALVGMVVPGLHSILVRFAVCIVPKTEGPDCLAFNVTAVKRRLRTVHLRVAAGGLSGEITALLRRPPVKQPSSGELRRLIPAGSFAGQAVLVVGGSRGLGELSAKLLAAGGANVVLTYANGETEANIVRQDIVAGGGLCETLKFDVLDAADKQFFHERHFTHVYYFATPQIFTNSSGLYSEERLREFIRFYVDGFWKLANILKSDGAAVSLFYPSTVAIDERPRGMTEYVMAKLAGETLCADMNKLMSESLFVTVERLPRLRTDQTASLIDATVADAVQVLLPIILKMQACLGDR